MKQTKQKIITSNVRFPEDEWLQLKIASSSHGMSTNEYVQYLSRTADIKNMTGTKQVTTKARGYAAMEQFLNRKIIRKPMGASEDDKVIYGIED